MPEEGSFLYYLLKSISGVGVLLLIVIIGGLAYGIHQLWLKVREWNERRVLGSYDLIRNGRKPIKPPSAKEQREIEKIETGT